MGTLCRCDDIRIVFENTCGGLATPIARLIAEEIKTDPTAKKLVINTHVSAENEEVARESIENAVLCCIRGLKLIGESGERGLVTAYSIEQNGMFFVITLELL